MQLMLDSIKMVFFESVLNVHQTKCFPTDLKYM